MAKKTRKFGGKTYRLYRTFEFCGDAKKKVKELRKKGQKARVVRISEYIPGRKPYEQQWRRCAVYRRK